MLVAISQVLRINTPIALRAIEGHDVAGITGIAFIMGGTGECSQRVHRGRYFRIGRLCAAMVTCSMIAGGAILALGLMHAVALMCAALAALMRRHLREPRPEQTGLQANI